MGAVFGVCGPLRKGQQIQSRDEDMLDLKLKRDLLVRQKLKLDTNIQELTCKVLEVAKLNRKDLAIRILRKKKHHESLLNQAEDALLQVETLISSVEAAYIQADVIRALAKSNDALKRVQSEFSVQEIDDIMIEAEELRENQQQLSEAIRSSAAAGEESVLLDELEKIMHADSLALPELPPVPMTTTQPILEFPKQAVPAS